MQPLHAALKFHFGLDCVECQPKGPVWKLSTTTGQYLLKKMKSTPERLLWLAESIESLSKAGFKGLIPFLRAKTNLPYFEFEKHFYIVMPWINGLNPTFSNRRHLVAVAKLLSKMHRFSNLTLKIEKPTAKPVEVYQNKLQFLEELYTKLQQTKQLNRIDRGILRWFPYYLTQARLGLTLLNDYSTYWTIPINHTGFCHKDPAPQNIIIQNKDWILIDYELAAPDWFITELTTFIQRVFIVNHWKPDLFDLICTTYHDERPLADEETKLIRMLLCFPQRFWRLCSQRYDEKLPWTEQHFHRKFWHLFDEEPDRAQCLHRWFPDVDIKTVIR